MNEHLHASLTEHAKFCNVPDTVVQDKESGAGEERGWILSRSGQGQSALLSLDSELKRKE